jgi:hypothetical protein
MSTRQVDYITEDLYESLSFMDSELPDLETVRELFYPPGLLINMSFGKPITYTIDSFVESLQEQIEEEQLTQFMQRELFAKTEIFGRIARRTSVYEYSLRYHEINDLPRGVNYIQFIQVGDLWRISSMIWNDENVNYKVPKEMLGGA